MISGGGIWTIGIIVALAFGYARVFGARRIIYKVIIGMAVGVVVSSQLFLEASHPFYQSVHDDLIFLFWAGYIAVPLAIYTLFVRWARKKAEARHDP